MTNQTFAATAAPRLVPACISTLCRAMLALLLLACVAPSVGLAQSQTWIPTNPNNDWSLTAPNWDAGVPWTNGSSAIFGGTGETVEIADDITVNNITFNSNGYTIADADGSSIFSLSTGSILTVTTGGHVATITENIAAGDINKAGAGILLLSGNNTFDGTVSVTTGTLRLGSNSALGSTVGATSVSGTAIIELQNGVTIGETITVGSGGDNNGGLRAGVSASATLSGSILLNPTNRLGAL
ncbi:MAG: autotransporter-associated beta strand repeat-containing protein, partial [Prosthecobacter sp.]